MNTELSHVIGPADSPLLDLTIGQLLARACDVSPDQEAVVACHQQIRLTYRDLERESDNFAKGLADLGLEHGDRIGIWSPNNVEWIITMYAAAKLGLVLVNVNPAYRPSELEYALNKVGCKALVMAGQFKTSNYPDMLCQLAPEVAGSEAGRLNADRLPDLRTLILVGDTRRDGFLLFSEVSAAGDESGFDLETRAVACQSNDPVNIQFTSGTTGSPKGATLSHFNIVNNGTLVGNGMALSDIDRVCAPVPLYHCFGMVMGSTLR